MTQQILINPPGTEKVYEKLQFSQAVRVGDTVWVSGQVGMDETGMAGDGIEEQARLAFQNLQRVLEAAGSSTYKVLLTLIESVLSEDPELYASIQMSLPHVTDFEKLFRERTGEWADRCPVHPPIS